MEVEEQQEDRSTHQRDLVREILAGNDLPTAIRGVEIPKTNGKKRLLGIPTVVDRWLQQAVSQQLMTRFEQLLPTAVYSIELNPPKAINPTQSKSIIKIAIL